MATGNKSKNNFFQDQIKKNGEESILLMNPTWIQTQAKRRIFREMVRGDINYEVYGKFFQDPKFLENLIIAAKGESDVCTIQYMALREYELNHPGIPLTSELVAHYYALMNIYNTLHTQMTLCRNNYYNVAYLTGIAPVLATMKNHI